MSTRPRRPERRRPAGQQLPPRLEARAEPIHLHGLPDPSPTKTTTESQTPVVTDSVDQNDEVPRYLRLVRKEARVRDDQAEALAALRRRVLRQRRDRTEPITDNTLLRVAVDLLLAHQAELAGDTEDELRASLGLPRTDSNP